MAFEQLVHKSELIVTGKVGRSWSAWGPSHEFIWTHYEVAVESALKGRPGKSVTVSEPGGSAEGLSMRIPGMLQFAPGEHVLLFLYKTPIGYLRPVAEAQGKYEITQQGRIHESAEEPGPAGPLEGIRVDALRQSVRKVVLQ